MPECRQKAPAKHKKRNEAQAREKALNLPRQDERRDSFVATSRFLRCSLPVLIFHVFFSTSFEQQLANLFVSVERSPPKREIGEFTVVVDLGVACYQKLDSGKMAER